MRAHKNVLRHGVNLVDKRLNFFAGDRIDGSQGWEAVGARWADVRRLALEWKSVSDSRRTRFDYTLYDPASGTVQEIDRQTYRRAHRATPIGRVAREAGAVLNPLLSRVLADYPDARVVDFEVHRGGESEHFLFNAEDQPAGGTAIDASRSAALKVPIRWVEDRILALLPDGWLYWVAADGGAVSRLQLGALPEGFLFTDFAALGDGILATWEQADFYRVGLAGLLIREEPL